MWRDQNFANAFRAISKQGAVAGVFAGATGGRRDSFFSQKTVEHLTAEIGEELHAQYLLSFTPNRSAPRAEGFQAIQVSVKDRPDLNVRARTGYWLNTEGE